jgi:H+/Cl- antiporter ClcA
MSSEPSAAPSPPARDSLTAQMPRPGTPLQPRVLWISTLAIALGLAAALVARALTMLIGLITNLSFYGRVDTSFVSPAGNRLGLWVIAVPVLGGLIVGVMARYGSRAIRGHGIPEAMEQVLTNDSRIAPRVTWLKPVSSAIAIGTGGPFGAEGPIIATGGALGSLIGQLLHVSADERKTLLAAGAAGGMAAVFAAPFAAVFMAIELLLFERRARSLIPVVLACISATGLRYVLEGSAPMFPMPGIATQGLLALAACAALGVIVGLISIGVTRATYVVEDLFEKLPLHWMWWPALGGIAVGVVGYFAPLTLGVGYANIAAIVTGTLGVATLLALCVLKFVSWAIALGSGTSGGTLAPLFTIGGALGALLGLAAAHWLPWLHLDPRVAAVVGMAALFAGSSRALLTSVVFAFETTQQPHALLPLLAGCATAFLVSGLLMRTTIMTEKLARRGLRVPADYSADDLEQARVRDVCSRGVVSLRGAQTVAEVRAWLQAGGTVAAHQGYPVLDADVRLLGVLTRRDLLDAQVPGTATLDTLIHHAPLLVHEDHSLREAADHMVAADVGRLVVVAADDPRHVLGMLTRGDVLAAHGRRIRAAEHRTRHINLRWRR